jgi:CheY-like chemotaxis protein
METTWARIWQDFRITIWFLSIAIATGLSFLLLQGVGLRIMAILWALAVMACGALIGFLFGIPRVLQTADPVSAIPETGEKQPTPNINRPIYRMQVNTNLEQISDWLTKIIVGFGLIELRNVPEHLNKVTLFIANGLGSPPQAQVLAIALVLYFFVVGFLGGYLMTRIYLAQAFSRADWGAQNTIVVAGSELTVSEVSEQSRTLLADLQDQILNLQRGQPAASGNGQETTRTITPATRVRSVLWVDDNPKNNSFLVERLSKLGIQVTQVLSTAEAMSLLRSTTFDRIVSDMGRLEGIIYKKSAGLDLIRQMRESNITTDIAFYCSSKAVAQFRDEATRLGAVVITSSPTELLQALQIEELS